jgi:hypothetical protein
MSPDKLNGIPVLLFSFYLTKIMFEILTFFLISNKSVHLQ